MNQLEKIKLKFKIGRVFTPSAPIDSAALFAGRTAQMARLMNAASQRGQHAVLFGERGVGKTSLANVLKDFLKPHSGFVIVSTNCEATTNFKAIWTNVFNELVVIEKEVGMGFNPPTHTEASSLSERLSDNPSPEEVRQLLQRLGKPVIVIIDELDRIKDQEAIPRLADTIKTLSDHSTDSTLVLVGVADSLDSLIEEHRSIDRALVQIQMPRMSPAELREIINKGLKELAMEIDAFAARRISNLSHGLPHYTHSLALYAAQAAVDRDSMAISQEDVVEAIKSAIENTQQSIKKKYHDATSSPRGNLYSEVLLSCALAETDELGYFPTANVRKPMSAIMGKYYDIPAFSRHLSDFCEPSRGAVLQKTGYPRRYRFRFVNPLMEPFVVMKGISNGLINADILDSEKPVIHPGSNETPPLFEEFDSIPEN